MSENASVVIFPSTFSQNKIHHLVENIKKILKIKNQQFQSIKRDNPLIIIKANDPVFASSAVNLLFGIQKVAIAKQVKNDFNSLVSEITKIGGNLLLKGETFYVRVEGYPSGYVPRDVEMAATSSLIEKKVNIDAKPGSEDKFDKLLYAYVTRSNAYVCIFIDEGHGGIPTNSQGIKTICSVYDELSTVSCIETLKEGFDVKIIVCYNLDSDLLNLVKILNQILPRTLKSNIEIEFYKIPVKKVGAKNILNFLSIVTSILINSAKSNKIDHISLPLSPLIFPSDFVDYSIKQVFDNGKIPQIPVSSLDDEIFETAREIGIEKHLSKIEKLSRLKFSNLNITSADLQKLVTKSIQTRKIVPVTLGPNNIHDILDSLSIDH